MRGRKSMSRNAKTCKATESMIQIQFKSNNVESLCVYYESNELLHEVYHRKTNQNKNEMITQRNEIVLK